MLEAGTVATQSVRRSARWPAAVTVAATLVSAVLVLWQLGDRSFWHDEAFGVGVIDRPLGDALWRLAHWEVNQSPFYLLLAGWWRLGTGEGFLRLLPAVAAVLSVPAIAHLGRRIADARVGAIAAGLLALHPLAVEWGQQLRAYSLVMLLTIVATILLLRAVEDPTRLAPAVAYGVLAAVATYTHFFAGLVIGAHVAWLVLRRPLPRQLLVTAGSVYGVLVLPLAFFLVTRDGDPLQWVGDTGFRDAVVDVAKGLTGGTRWSVLVYGAAAALGAWHVVSRHLAPRPLDRSGLPAPVLAVIWLLAPVVAVTVSTATVKPLLEARFLIVVVPALVLVVAIGLCAVPRRVAVVVGAAVVVVSIVGIDRWYDHPAAENWREATSLASAATGADGVVVVEPWSGVFALRYYEQALDLPPLTVLRPGPLDPPAGDRLVEVRSIGPTGQRARTDPLYAAWRDAHYEPGASRWAGGIVVQIFERR